MMILRLHTVENLQIIQSIVLKIFLCISLKLNSNLIQNTFMYIFGIKTERNLYAYITVKIQNLAILVVTSQNFS